MRVVLYARYSSDNQRDASIEDQMRICRAHAARHSWTIVGNFADHAISGTSLLRNGYQSMLARIREGGIDIILAESLDRISRDQEHIAAFYKQVSFAGARIITLAEGEISDLHIGLKGAMGAIYLKDLAAKTHRGLAGRIVKGRSIGAAPYGYRVVRRFKADGELDRGLREIVPDQAVVVRRIFADYLAGKSPRAIARDLNLEGVPGPTGGIWFDTVIRGRAARNDGLLRNPLYVGRLVWNRLASSKNPVSGRRVRRANLASALVQQEVPELTIVSRAVWQSVQDRLAREEVPARAGRAAAQADTKEPDGFWQRRRARHLLSGKVVCGLCSGQFFAVGKHYLACRAASLRACANMVRPSRLALEGRVASVLAQELMDPELAEAFADAFARTWQAFAAEAAGDVEQHRRELQHVERKIANLVDALAEGLRTPDIRLRLAELERRREEVLAAVNVPQAAMPVIPPELGRLYRVRMATLQRDLEGPENTEAREAARALIDKVIITPAPNGGEPRVELVGNLAAMIGLGGAPAAARDTSILAQQVLAMFQSSTKEEPGALPLDPAGAGGPRPRSCSAFCGEGPSGCLYRRDGPSPPKAEMD
jgi:site-specific DNA recombinase